jgi:L-fuculose-phosphate aldolase
MISSGSMYEQFRDVGRDLFLSGLVTSHGGNMSVRLGDRVLITRRGAMLGRLMPDDIVETGLEQDDPTTASASMELPVHRAIYLSSPRALAIVHTHPIHATALSFVDDSVIPVDTEGAYWLKRVPVLVATETFGSADVARLLPTLLRDDPIALVRGHGAFAVGKRLEEAYMASSTLEASAHILHLRRSLRRRDPV